MLVIYLRHLLYLSAPSLFLVNCICLSAVTLYPFLSVTDGTRMYLWILDHNHSFLSLPKKKKKKNHKWSINLFGLMESVDVRNELWKGTSTFGSKALSQDSLLLCCVWAARFCEGRELHKAAVTWETHLQRCCSDYCLPVLLPFSPFLSHSLFLFPSFFSSLLQCFASIPLSLFLSCFCSLGILRTTSGTPSLLKIHCQINIKTGGEIHLVQCNLLWSATHSPVQQGK